MDGTANIAELPPPAPQVHIGNLINIPAVRQLLLLIGVAASVAVGFALFSWSQTPDFAPVYGQLEERDRMAVKDALVASGIEHRINAQSGAVEVRSDQIHAARIQLAAQGLPSSAALSMADLGEGSTFGTSQFMESAKYQHTLEAELSATIQSLRAVQKARVHLAIPRESSFIRDRRRPSASVLLHLYGGAVLEPGKAIAIVNLVASSIPSMQQEDVTLVDQFGRLLSQQDGMSDEALTATQFNIVRMREDNLRQRIESMLGQIVGPGNVIAEVNADLDFTITEQTTESYDPTSQVIRSEQTSEQQRSGTGGLNGGTPGALANTPPQAGGNPNPQLAGTEQQVNSSRQSTRNFEVDKTISVTRQPTGTVRRLSVAVIVNESALIPQSDLAADDEQGETPAPAENVTPISVEEQLLPLVREAVGFDPQRGDTVEVVAAPFQQPEALGEVEGPPIWKQPIVRELAKQALGVILALAVAFGVVRPMLKSIVETPATAVATLLPDQSGASISGQIDGPSERNVALSYDEKVAAARNITGHDPARVAQVVRRWIETEDG
ncbi:MAG: flagellar basal-body MS-ring/collar protein FliF [Pseudomonadota bacterium]